MRSRRQCSGYLSDSLFGRAAADRLRCGSPADGFPATHSGLLGTRKAGNGVSLHTRIGGISGQDLEGH